MEKHRLLAQIGAARAKLKSAYESTHPEVHYDIVVQAELHCRRVAGISTPYDHLIDRLEKLELEYEHITREIFLPRWRARRIFMNELIEKGEIDEQDNIERAAAFLSFIDKRLAGDNMPTKIQEGAHEYLKTILHPVIVQSSWHQFQEGFLRDAVLNAYVAIGDLIRSRTGLTQDGRALAELALSLTNPRLILSTLESESGKNDQLGFMLIISGAFMGIRNPKAHSLEHDLDVNKAIQYLVLASLLARRVTEAQSVGGKKYVAAPET